MTAESTTPFDPLGGRDMTPAEQDALSLRRAVLAGDADAVRALLARGVPADARIMDTLFGMLGETPLMLAVSRGDVVTARLLLEAGADAFAADDGPYGETVCNYAFCREDPLPMLELLFEFGVGINAVGCFGETLLMIAAEDRMPELLGYLLEHGADVHARDADQRTALMHAIDWYDDAAALLLLEHGAEVNARDFRGQTALMMAVRMREDDLLDLRNPEAAVRCYLDDDSDLDEEIADTMLLLLDHGADPHVVDGRGWNALLLALARGCTQSARLLLARGATLAGAESPAIRRAWEFARRNGYEDAVSLLEELVEAKARPEDAPED